MHAAKSDAQGHCRKKLFMEEVPPPRFTYILGPLPQSSRKLVLLGCVNM